MFSTTGYNSSSTKRKLFQQISYTRLSRLTTLFCYVQHQQLPPRYMKRICCTGYQFNNITKECISKFTFSKCGEILSKKNTYIVMDHSGNEKVYTDGNKVVSKHWTINIV